MLSSATQNDLSGLDGRVTFMPHDFFTDQPVSGAAAYLLRYITHNWSDSDCVRIFRALVPALEKSLPGTPVLINDVVLPDYGSNNKYRENRMRQVDIMMMLVLGAKQRSEKDFRSLLAEADPRFTVSYLVVLGSQSFILTNCSKIKAIHGKGDMKLIEAYLRNSGTSGLTEET
jgi:hypothetical protein